MMNSNYRQSYVKKLKKCLMKRVSGDRMIKKSMFSFIGMILSICVILSILLFLVKVESSPIDPFATNTINEYYELLLEHHGNVNKTLKIITTMTKYIKKQNKRLSLRKCNEIASEIYIQSVENNIPYELIIGIIATESRFNSLAVSKKGAKGLMQIYDKSCRHIIFDQNRLFDIDYNIECGIMILLDKKRNCDTIERTLRRYSGGHKDYEKNVLSEVGKFLMYEKG